MSKNNTGGSGKEPVFTPIRLTPKDNEAQVIAPQEQEGFIERVTSAIVIPAAMLAQPNPQSVADGMSAKELKELYEGKYVYIMFHNNKDIPDENTPLGSLWWVEEAHRTIMSVRRVTPLNKPFHFVGDPSIFFYRQVELRKPGEIRYGNEVADIQNFEKVDRIYQKWWRANRPDQLRMFDDGNGNGN